MLMCLDKFGEDEKGGKRPAEIGLLLMMIHVMNVLLYLLFRGKGPFK